ncbi:MAG: ornithine carbamoyltransferase, partial [Leptospiraceae bacterium]|nr:ornithine carbamoyltransferase [Leptospiraceae bacterium]
MNTEKPIKHLISWNDWTDSEIRELLDYAVYVKNNRVLFSGHMAGRTLAMLFQKTSTRTRVSFEAGMTEMGGHAIYLDWLKSNFQLSDIDLEAHYLSRNVALIMARMKKHEDLLLLKKGSLVPVINGCCDRYHPCQSLADILTIHLDRGKAEGAHLCYIGVHNNVVNSLIGITSAIGLHLTLVTPIAEEESIDRNLIKRAEEKGTLSWESNPKKAVRDAEYVYTDTWVNMEFFNDPAYQEEKEKRIELMMPFQINKELMSGSKAKIMHDMPIHSGYEITREMVESERSIIFPQSENRLD